MRLCPHEKQQRNTPRLHQPHLLHFLVLSLVLEAHLASCGERECLETIRKLEQALGSLDSGHVDRWKPMGDSDPRRAQATAHSAGKQ